MVFEKFNGACYHQLPKHYLRFSYITGYVLDCSLSSRDFRRAPLPPASFLEQPLPDQAP